MRTHISSCPQWTWTMVTGRRCPDSAWDVMARKNVWFTHSARTAIFRACELAGLVSGAEVLAPAYHCGTEIDTLMKAGARVRFYQVDASAQINLVDLADRISPDTKAIYLTHYFGCSPPVHAVKSLCRHHNLFLIEDRALASFGDRDTRPDDAAGDLVVYCFKKTFPVADGGALQIRNATLSAYPWDTHHLPRHVRALQVANLCKQSIGIALRRRGRLHSPEPLDSGPDSQMPESYLYDHAGQTNRSISPASARMLQRVSALRVVHRRRENFMALQAQLHGKDDAHPRLSQLSPDVCPIFYPVLVDQRAAVLDRLHRRGVGAIGFWSGYHPDIRLQEFPDARRLKDHLIGLPVHQDLGARDMDYVASSFLHAVGGP